MNTTIFTLVHQLFLRRLPFAEPERLIHVYQEDKSRNIEQGPTSVPKFWHYRDAQNVFSDFAADAGTGFILTGLGEPIQIKLYQVSPHNPVLLATAAILLAFVALIACLFPARRATLVNPMQALRAE